LLGLAGLHSLQVWQNYVGQHAGKGSECLIHVQILMLNGESRIITMVPRR
jgi:hypothetical protein